MQKLGRRIMKRNLFKIFIISADATYRIFQILQRLPTVILYEDSILAETNIK
jgi:hypothetical protein